MTKCDECGGIATVRGEKLAAAGRPVATANLCEECKWGWGGPTAHFYSL